MPAYKNYGGRGISVCNRWTEKDTGYINFLKDMGRRPSKLHTLDRLCNDGNYESVNCAWRTRSEQSANKRNNVTITFNGVTNIIAEWSRILGGSSSLVCARIKAGWSESDAVSVTLGGKRKNEA